MPSLRELLGASIVSGDYCDFFEALVEAVEPEDISPDAIRKLRKERDSAELKLETLKAIDERILADAALGRLVLGMRPHTRIIKGGKCYWPEFLEHEVWQKTRRPGFSPDPAEALRAIQEEGDE